MQILCHCFVKHLVSFNVRRNAIFQTAFSKRSIFVTCTALQLAKNSARTTSKLKKTGVPKFSDIKKLMLLAKPEKYRLIGGITLLAVSSGVMMSVPFFMGRIIDLVFKDPDESTPNAGVSENTKKMEEKLKKEQKFQVVTANMKKYMLGLVLFFSCGALATFGRVYLMNFAGERVVNRLRTKAFSSIIKQDISFFDKSKTGELINRLSNDVWTVGYATTMNISDGLRGLVGAIGGTTMMFYVSPGLAVVGLSIVPPVAAIAIVYGRYIRTITKQMNDALAESTDIAEERISNIRTVRAFGAEMSEERRYNRKIDSVLDIAKRESVAKGLFYGFNMLSGNLIMLALLYSGGSLIAAGTISVGDLSSFLLYALYVGVSMSGISSFYSELMHGIGASARLFELMDRKPRIPLSGGIHLESLTGLIEFKNLHFHYPTRKEVQVLKGLNLVVPAKSSLAVVGSSGSGKSTLASLLLRFYDASKGSVCIDGIDIKDIDPHCLRSHIGVVTQEPVLFSCSIKENIAYSAERLEAVSMSDIEEAARQAHAFDFIKQFPQGFDTIMGERGQTLSGGQRQRIAIARALLKNPKILLMDEATSALDSESEHAVRQTFDSLMYGGDRTIIIIAHRLSTILNADQIAVLHDGKIVEIGTYWQLMSIDDGHFRKLVQRQMVGMTADEANQQQDKQADADDNGDEFDNSGEEGATAEKEGPATDGELKGSFER